MAAKSTIAGIPLQTEKQNSVITGDIHSLKYTSFFLSLSYLSFIEGNKPLLLCSLHFKELEAFLTVNGVGTHSQQATACLNTTHQTRT